MATHDVSDTVTPNRRQCVAIAAGLTPSRDDLDLRFLIIGVIGLYIDHLQTYCSVVRRAPVSAGCHATCVFVGARNKKRPSTSFVLSAPNSYHSAVRIVGTSHAEHRAPVGKEQTLPVIEGFVQSTGGVNIVAMSSANLPAHTFRLCFQHRREYETDSD